MSSLGLHYRRRRRLIGLGVAVLSASALTIATAPQANAFSTLPDIWKRLREGTVCGSHSTAGGAPYTACRIRAGSINRMKTHTGWPAVAAQAGNRWCKIIDSQTGVADMCFVDYTTGGGFDTHGVTVDAANLGAPDAAGRATLAREFTLSAYDDPNSSYNILQTAKIETNENGGIPWYISSNSASSYSVPAGKYDMQTVLTHEFGHAAGLAHPASAGSATSPVMNACIGAAYTNFGKTDDGNGDRWLYGGFNSSLYGSPTGVNAAC